MHAARRVDTDYVRPLDALVIALGLSILALCSWPVMGAGHRSHGASVAWPLLTPATTP